MKRNILNSPRLLELKKRRRRIILNKSFFWGVLFLIIFTGLSFISRLDSLNISGIEIVGNKLVETEIVKEIVEQELMGNYFWIFPKTNILFYPKNDIEKELSTKFKRLKDITFSTGRNKVLEVSVTERVALYMWCGVVFEFNNDKSSPCYFLNEDGFIFDEAPYFSGEVYFKFYGAISLMGDTPSGSSFSPDIFQKLILFKEALEGMGLKPASLYVQENKDIRIFLSSSNLLTGPEIIFKTNADFQKIAENLQAALTTEPLQIDFQKKYSSLLYIDLRFGNKVYYKFR